jgi:hypothetical protein
MGDDTTAAMAIPANCLYLFDFRHIILPFEVVADTLLVDLNRVLKNLPDDHCYVIDDIITEVFESRSSTRSVKATVAASPLEYRTTKPVL